MCHRSCSVLPWGVCDTGSDGGLPAQDQVWRGVRSATCHGAVHGCAGRKPVPELDRASRPRRDHDRMQCNHILPDHGSDPRANGCVHPADVQPDKTVTAVKPLDMMFVAMTCMWGIAFIIWI